MGYVPNLVPDNLKVLPDYFKLEKTQEKSKKKHPISTLMGVLLLCVSFGGFFEAPIAAIFLFCISIIILPGGHRSIERILKFKLTPKSKVIFLIPFIIGFSIPMTTYIQQEIKKANLARIDAEKQELIAKKRTELKRQKKDSLNIHIKKGIALEDQKKLDDALKEFDIAGSFITDKGDKIKIDQQKHRVKSIKAIRLVESGKYRQALPELTDLLSKDPHNTELAYYRAVCYSKIGKIKEAVFDLRSGVEEGDFKSIKLRDKLNPIRKRISHYVTLCCDGSTSDASGRGACSHHGGVCDWNHPIYEEYRKY